MKREIFKFCLFFWALQSIQVAATPNWPAYSVTHSLNLAKNSFKTKNQAKLYELSLDIFAKIYQPDNIIPTAPDNVVIEVLDDAFNYTQSEASYLHSNNPMNTKSDIAEDIQKLAATLEHNSDMLAPSLIANLLEKRGLIDSEIVEEIANARTIGAKLIGLVGSMLPLLFENTINTEFIKLFVYESTSGIRSKTTMQKILPF